jgi:hypothetical protein
VRWYGKRDLRATLDEKVETLLEDAARPWQCTCGSHDERKLYSDEHGNECSPPCEKHRRAGKAPDWGAWAKTMGKK